MSGKRRTQRTYGAALPLACMAVAWVAVPGAAAAKGVAAGRLDPSFGKGGKAIAAFPAENAGDVGVKVGDGAAW